MLAMSHLFPSLGWEYPIEIGTQHYHEINNNWNLDSLIIPTNNNFTTFQPQNDHNHNNQLLVKRSESLSSPGSASSSRDNNNNNSNHFCGNVLAKKLHHNASERDRRKKINNLYSTLRDLLPSHDHSKKLSIPVTIGRVLKYIPELQKEVELLIHKKEEFLYKFTQLREASNNFIQEEKSNVIRNHHSCSISTSKLGKNEIIIQVSSLEDISLSEVLVKLENDGLVILDVSSFRSFGGSAFYNIHLWIEEANNTVKYDKLNEELQLFIQKPNTSQTYY